MKKHRSQKTGEQSKSRTAHLAPHQFKKGQSGNPSGRPKGSKSLKEYAKEMLASMNDEERMEFMHGLPKEVIWKFAEGNPATTTDITSKGEKLEGNTIIFSDFNGKEENTNEQAA